MCSKLMSHLKKVPKEKIVSIPQGINILIVKDSMDNLYLLIKSSSGKNKLLIPKEIYLFKDNKNLRIGLKSYFLKEKHLLGSFYTFVRQKIRGLIQGFNKELQLVGVGFRASVKKDSLILSIGYSHKVNIHFNKDLKIVCTSPKTIFIKGRNLYEVGQKAAEIRSKRVPEPYKGKGIFYKGERIQKKEGKKL